MGEKEEVVEMGRREGNGMERISKERGEEKVRRKRREEVGKEEGGKQDQRKNVYKHGFSDASRRGWGPSLL